MKIHVNRIPVEGVREEAQYDPKSLDVDRFDTRPQPPITVSSWITKVEHELVVEAEISCRLQLCCARCLTPFEQPLRTGTLLSYPVRPSDVVDITEDVRQEIILAYPMVPLCRPDCKGICPVCGANRNATACDH